MVWNINTELLMLFKEHYAAKSLNEDTESNISKITAGGVSE